MPFVGPAACGLKLTATLTDWPESRMVFDPPLAPNPVPEAETLAIVTSEFPVFVKTTDCDDWVPTVTLPKLRLDMFAESWVVAFTPSPVRLTVRLPKGLLSLLRRM
jgi:hypothetical protein